MLGVIILSIVMASVTMQNVVMVSVTMLSIVMVNVVAPFVISVTQQPGGLQRIIRTAEVVQVVSPKNNPIKNEK